MNRRTFVRENFGLLCACLGCGLAACSKQAVEPQGPDADFIVIDLQTELLQIGSYKTTGGILVFRIAAANAVESFVALQSECPHAGGLLYWSPADNQVICPVHGSRFSQSGALLVGPAATPLKSYRMAISGNQLTVWLN